VPISNTSRGVNQENWDLKVMDAGLVNIQKAIENGHRIHRNSGFTVLPMKNIVICP